MIEPFLDLFVLIVLLWLLVLSIRDNSTKNDLRWMQKQLHKLSKEIEELDRRSAPNRRHSSEQTSQPQPVQSAAAAAAEAVRAAEPASTAAPAPIAESTPAAQPPQPMRTPATPAVVVAPVLGAEAVGTADAVGAVDAKPADTGFTDTGLTNTGLASAKIAATETTVAKSTYEETTRSEAHNSSTARAESEYHQEQEAQPLWPKMRQHLIAIGLWPDLKKGSLEAGLTTFLATRLGILLGVAALVFLATYLGRDMPPWLRFAELLAVPVALWALAIRLRNKSAGFARVLQAGSMAMFYFSSFAAYAMPAVKIIEQPWAGFAFQVVVLVLIGCYAVRRKDSAIAAMALLLGFAACFFAWHHELHLHLLSGSLLLGLGGAILYRLQRWYACLWIGMACSYGFYLLLIFPHYIGLYIHARSTAIAIPSMYWLQWLYPLLCYVVFFGAERLSAIHSGQLREDFARRHHSANTALALLATWLGIELFQPQNLALVLLIAAVIAALCSLSFRIQPRCEWLTLQFFLKSSLLFSLFLLEQLDGNTRALALLLQALILLEAMRRFPSKTVLVSALLAWVFSLAMFVQEMVQQVLQRSYSPQWQTEILWDGLYMFGSSAALALGAALASGRFSKGLIKGVQITCGILLALVATLNCVAGAMNATDLLATAFLTTVLLLLPTAFGYLGQKRSKNAVFREPDTPKLWLGGSIASGTLLVMSHVFSWGVNNKTILANQSAIVPWILATLGLSALLIFTLGSGLRKRSLLPAQILLVLSCITIWKLTSLWFSDAGALLLFAVLGTALIALASLPRLQWLPPMRLVPLIIATLIAANEPIHSGTMQGAQWPAWLALAVFVLWQILQPRWQPLKSESEKPGVETVAWVQGYLLPVLALLLVNSGLQGRETVIAAAAFMLLALLLRLSGQPRIWLMQATLLLLIALADSVRYWLFDPHETFASSFALQVVLSVLTLALAQALSHNLQLKRGKEINRMLFSLSALITLIPLLIVPVFTLESLMSLSLWWAASIFALIAAGIVLRHRPYRIIGLVCLLLPLLRLFLYDIQDTLQSIIAFGIVAVLLLVLGYTYSRLRDGGKNPV